MATTCEFSLRDGRVACPLKGDIDVEVCYRCPRLRAFYDEESGTKVVCSTPPRVLEGLRAALGSTRHRR
jgi:hypothetical protein